MPAAGAVVNAVNILSCTSILSLMIALRISSDNPAVAIRQWEFILGLLHHVSNPALRRFGLCICIDATEDYRGALEQLKQLPWKTLHEKLKRFTQLEMVAVEYKEGVGDSDVRLEVERLLRRALKDMPPRMHIRQCKDSFL